MRITATSVRVRDPEAGAAAFAALLGLAVERDADGPLVRVGWTTIRPVEQIGDGDDHLAFLVPGDAYSAAEAWLLSRAPALLHDGEVDIAGPSGWDSTSVYFDGPDGLVLELIAHAGHRPGPFAGPEGLLGVCEVGIAVPDVLGAVAALGHEGVLPFAQDPSPGFTAVGDPDGRLILVPPGRTWFPTADRTSGLAPLHVDATAGRPARVRIGDAVLDLS